MDDELMKQRHDSIRDYRLFGIEMQCIYCGYCDCEMRNSNQQIKKHVESRTHKYNYNAYLNRLKHAKLVKMRRDIFESRGYTHKWREEQKAKQNERTDIKK